MMRIDLAYDGKDFHGWQLQPGLRTVQGDLNKEITRLLGWDATTIGAGRTDTGVHALRQTVHLGGVNQHEARRLESTLSRMGPEDMRILSVREVSPEFHARYSADWRRYEYRLSFRDDLFLRGTWWWIKNSLDRDAMEAACVHLLGRHDFRSFCKEKSWKDDNHCTVSEARFEWNDDGALFHVRADRFLHHMVRTMVGVLVEVGLGERRPEDIPSFITNFDRSAVGTMAPPQGLYLAEVGYPDELMDPGYRPETNESTNEAGEPGAQPEETP